MTPPYLAIYVTISIFLLGTVGHLVMLSWFFGSFKGAFTTKMETVEKDLKKLNDSVDKLATSSWSKGDGQREVEQLHAKVNATFSRIDDNAKSIRSLESRVTAIEAICGYRHGKHQEVGT